MIASKVYFYDNVKYLKIGVNKFFKMIGDECKSNEKVGIKVHFGEGDNDTFVDPKLLQDIPKFIKNPVFIECNVLYRGNRTKKEDHIKQAKAHGFGFIDIDILDGEQGEDYIEVEINKKNTKKAKIGKGLKKYNKVISIAHFKGHISTGFAGTLKNIGMGLGSRGGKLDMHAGISPIINEKKCTACGVCSEQCPANAITIDEFAIINHEICIGCAQCIAVCPENAIRIPWDARSADELSEKVAEYALAAVKGKDYWYINFLTKITMKCDCVSTKQIPFMNDIGILFSKDPVAIDKASIDLVIERNGNANPFESYNKNSLHMLKYAEEIGLGTIKYSLEKIK